MPVFCPEYLIRAQTEGIVRFFRGQLGPEIIQLDFSQAIIWHLLWLILSRDDIWAKCPLKSWQEAVHSTTCLCWSFILYRVFVLTFHCHFIYCSWFCNIWHSTKIYSSNPAIYIHERWCWAGIEVMGCIRERLQSGNQCCFAKKNCCSQGSCASFEGVLLCSEWEKTLLIVIVIVIAIVMTPPYSEWESVQAVSQKKLLQPSLARQGSFEGVLLCSEWKSAPALPEWEWESVLAVLQKQAWKSGRRCARKNWILELGASIKVGVH